MEGQQAQTGAIGEDLITAIQRDHAEIRSLFAEVESAPAGEAKRDAFQRLVRKLAVHETAEEEVVHPLARLPEDGEAVVEERLREEDEAKRALSELEQLGVDAPDFGARLEQFRQAVLRHAESEEREEHPRLASSQSQERLIDLADTFRTAESMAPTRPHPHGPESAVGNIVLGPFVAIADRVRDGLRKATQRGSQ